MPLQIVRENIVHMHTDAIVNAANSHLRPGGGVCGAIFDAAGYEMCIRDSIWCCYNEQVGYVAEQYLKVYTEWMEPNMGYDPSDAIGDMQVVNCNDWVSLRSGPSTSSKRIARVPAGTVVYGCYPDENGFIWCNFGGLCGYISSDYLAARG